MSRPVEERLRELESELQTLQILPAADIRARGRRRGRRQLAALTVAGAVVATTAGIAATTPLGWPHQGAAAPQPTGDGSAISCVLALPDSPATVQIRVLDGGTPAGLPDATASQLRVRRFTVLADTAGSTGDHTAGAADLRYGPAAIGAAALLRAELHGDVAMRFDPDRQDKTVDLILGPAFTRLATPTEVNQALAAAGEPSAPPQCSTVTNRTPGR
jgi:hypothetical protein